MIQKPNLTEFLQYSVVGFRDFRYFEHRRRYRYRFLRATALYAIARIMLSPVRLSVCLFVRLSHGCIIQQESHAVAGKPRDAAVNSDRYQQPVGQKQSE